MTIGVLALQGDFEAHRKMLEVCGVPVREVRAPRELDGCDALVLPGGESTTMSRLCDRYELWEPLRAHLQAGRGVFGTCAGMIMLAHGIGGATHNFGQKTLGALDIDVQRNAYGKQLDSFEADLDVPALREAGLGETPLRGVFIRAPRITRLGPNVKVLARHEGEPVAVICGPLLATAFHPEIAGDPRLHRFWLERLGLEQGL